MFMFRIICIVLWTGLAFSGELWAHDAPEAARSHACSKYLKRTLNLHHFSITTKSPKAQRLFDEGLTLAYSFNHAEAARSFRSALEADPDCAMCAWGLSYVLGPNINQPMLPEAVEPAFEALTTALDLAQTTHGREKALIEALRTRYQAEASANRSSLDQAYAEAMKEVAEAYPEDADVQALYGEALLDVSSWNYWNPDGTANERTLAILAALEKAMAIDPKHAGAMHFYIHAVEAVQPERGVEAADRLVRFNTAVGHMVHMPSHIYLRVGRYQDVLRDNKAGVALDKTYARVCKPEGIYADMYIPHNYDFLVAGANLLGWSRLAAKESRNLARIVASGAAHHGMFSSQQMAMTPLTTMVRFRHWDQILRTPPPSDHQIYARAVYHYARSLALGHKGYLTQAKAELERLNEFRRDPALEGAMIMGVNKAAAILEVAYEEASGILHALGKDKERALAALESAAKHQEQLAYMEPPPWHRSVRVVLGTARLAAGQYEQAAEEFRKDLLSYPKNGWGLYGLAKCLDALGQTAEARKVWEQFRVAWKHADSSPVMLELPAL